MAVIDITIKLRKEQSLVSQHLAILSKVGNLVTDQKVGLIYYSLDVDRLVEMSRIVEELWG